MTEINSNLQVNTGALAEVVNPGSGIVPYNNASQFNFESLIKGVLLHLKSAKDYSAEMLSKFAEAAQEQLSNFIEFAKENPESAVLIGITVLSLLAWAIRNSVKASNLQKENTNLKNDLENMSPEIERLNQQITNLTQELNETRTLREESKAELIAARRDIENLRDRLQEKEHELAETGNKARKICANYKDQVAELTQKIMKLQIETKTKNLETELAFLPGNRTMGKIEEIRDEEE